MRAAAASAGWSGPAAAAAGAGETALMSGPPFVATVVVMMVSTAAGGMFLLERRLLLRLWPAAERELCAREAGVAMVALVAVLAAAADAVALADCVRGTRQKADMHTFCGDSGLNLLQPSRASSKKWVKKTGLNHPNPLFL